jgi:hypothetical protein
MSSALARIERDRAVATLNAAAADREAAAAASKRELAIREFVQSIGTYRPDIQTANEQQNAGIRNDITDLETQARDYRRIATELGQLSNQTWEQLVNGQGNAGNRTAPAAGDPRGRSQAITDLRQEAELTLARLRHEMSRVRALEDAEQIEKRTAILVQGGLQASLARVEAESMVRAERDASNAEAMRQYELSQLQDRIELARISNNVSLLDILSDQRFAPARSPTSSLSPKKKRSRSQHALSKPGGRRSIWSVSTISNFATSAIRSIWRAPPAMSAACAFWSEPAT